MKHRDQKTDINGRRYGCNRYEIRCQSRILHSDDIKASPLGKVGDPILLEIGVLVLMSAE